MSVESSLGAGMALWNKSNLMLSGVSAITLTFAFSGIEPAYAQESQHSSRPETKNATVLDPIIITAREFDERFQNLPVSANVVMPDNLATTPFSSGPAIAHNSPNVSWVDRGAGTQFFSIRGVSALGTPLNFDDGTVGFSVNGVPNSMMSASNALLDVSRVEVLRGPQGTTSINNALGGVINVVSNEPDGQRDIRFTTEFGSNGYKMGEAVIGGNILPDVLDGRIAVRFANEDGDIDSLNTDDLGARKIRAARGGFRFTGLDDTVISLTGSYLSDDTNSPVYVVRDAPGFPVSGLLTEPYAKTTHGDVNLKIEHDFDNFRFTSTSAYQRNEGDRHSALIDPLMLPEFLRPLAGLLPEGGTRDKENIYSQEFRLNSLDNDEVRWSVGASVVRTEGSRACDLCSILVAPVTTTTDVDSTSFGVFGDVTVPFGERWEVSLGGRLSYDDIKARFGNNGGIAALTGRNSTDQAYATGRAALAYKWTDDIRSYVSLSRGHGKRVFTLLPDVENGVLPDAFPASTGWTYEAGVKASLFNQRLDVEASVFHNDIKNGLLSYLDPQDPLVFRDTYQDYKTSGFEVRTKLRLTDSLSLMNGVGYTHSELGAGGQTLNIYKGNRAPNTPEWAFNTGLQYDASAPFDLPGEVSFNLEHQYVGSRAADAEGSFDLEPYHLVNARIGWKDNQRGFEVYAFGRNLFDKRYETYGATAGLPAGIAPPVEIVNVGQGRVIGLGMTKRF